MNKCLNCNKEVVNKFCDRKCQGDYSKKEIKEFKVCCFKCGKEITVKEREKNFPKKERYYCSRKCANIRKHSNETKQKISVGIKDVYLKDPTYKKRCIKNNKRNFKSDGINYSKIEKICIGCGKQFYVHHCTQDKKFCSRICYRENIKKFMKTLNPNSGGYRGSSPDRGKNGWYKGYWCDSSWELAWVIYNLDHNINFERNYDKFEYFYKEKKLNYIPDFKINDNYIEIKGFETEKDKAKFEYFPHKLIILRRKEMYDILKYTKTKYGQDYIRLYEGNPYNDKNKNCEVCGTFCKNIYCSRECAGIGVNKKYKNKK
jgi:hypothetical protein